MTTRIKPPNDSEFGFVRQDSLEEAWRVMRPLIDQPPPVHTYGPGTWGPDAADALVAKHGGWRTPWVK